MGGFAGPGWKEVDDSIGYVFYTHKKSSESAQEKALRINLDAAKYGTIAEIGAGQEVTRLVKASATIARSISAYDMAISTSLYGPTEHYVSRLRLESMLNTEFIQLTTQLGGIRGERILAALPRAGRVPCRSRGSRIGQRH